MKKKIIFLIFTLGLLNSCANMTAQDWQGIETGLKALNCSMYQTDCDVYNTD